MSLKTKILASVTLMMIVVMSLITVNIQAGTRYMRLRMDKELRSLMCDTISESMEDMLFRQGVTDVEQLKKRLLNTRVLESWILVDENRNILLWDRDSNPVGLHIDDLGEYDIPTIERKRFDAASGKQVPVMVDLIDEVRNSRSTRIQGSYVAIPLAGIVTGSAPSSDSEILWVLLGRTVPILKSYDGLSEKFYRLLFWVMGLGTVLVLGIVYILLHRFVLRPIDILKDEFHRVADGDYLHELRPFGRAAELDQMVEAFNTMREKLRGSKEELEREVFEATRQVKKSTQDLMLAQRMNALGLLAAGVAHEINNPLGGMINASLRIARDDIGPAKKNEYLDLIDDGLRRIQEIVQRVLIFGHHSDEEIPFLFTDVIEQARQLLAYKLEQQGIEFSVSVDPALAYVGSPGGFVQLFLNLFSNSIDAMSDGGRLKVSIALQENRIAIVVADTGEGMTSDEQNAVFDLFFTTKSPGQGTGLGMAVVYNIIVAYQGTIEVYSVKHEGCEIRIALPLKIPREK